MNKAEYKVKDGKLIKIQLTQTRPTISKIKITGDFFLHPETLIDELETTLQNHPLNQEELTKTITQFLTKKDATLLGAAPADFAKCIMMAAKNHA